MSGSSSGTGTGGPFRGIYVASGLAHVGATSGGASGTGNTIGSLGATGSITYTSSSTSASDLTGIYNYGSSNWIVMNNNIGGVTVSNSSTGAASFYAIRCYTSTSVATTIQNNTIGGAVANSIQSTTTATGTVVQGYYAQSSNSTVTGNTIRNMTSAGGTGTGSGPALAGIVMFSTSVNNTVSQNTIHSLSNTHATTVGHVTGIMYQSSSGTNLVERNLIHSLSAASASAVINGIYINAGTTTYRNNMIRLGINAAGNSIMTGCAINGISETIAGTDNMYFNSVFIGGWDVGGAANTFAFQSAITLNTRNYLDNIFWNNRSNGGSGTGKHYAIKVGGSAANPAGLTSNYNDLLANGTGGVLGLFNAVDQPTLAAWRTATGQDLLSLSGNPQFIAPNGDAATVDLHIHATNPTPIEQAGSAVGSVTDDFDGQLRASWTPTDIGADAGNFVAADISPPAISYTPLPNTCSLVDRTLTATITDATGVPTSGIGLPVLYWKINAGAYTDTVATYGGGNSYTFYFGAGVSPGDVVSYYICAQDTVATPNVGSQPAGASGFTANPPAAGTPPPSPSTYSVQSTLAAGTYSIPGSYATLTAAVADYNTKCMGGAIVFELAAGYSSAGETFPITINAHADASPTNTLTIRPAAGQTPTISGSLASGALIKLNGADYVILDGSNSGGTDRSLTITNSATTAPCAIWISSLGNGAGATNDVVKNCNINTNGGATAYGIAVSGATIASAGGDNDNVTLQNNAIASLNIGVYANGNAAVSAGGMDNLSVTGNAFTSASTSSPVYGVQLANALNASVSADTLNLTTSSGTSPVGISLEANVSGSSVTGNWIKAVVTTSTGGWGGRGITVGTGTTSSNITIANNFIAGVNGSNYSSFGNSSAMGIALGVVGNSSTLTTITGGIALYHNSVNMAGNYSYAAACLTAGLYVGSNASVLDIRNNVIVNSLNNTNASGSASKNYSVYSAAANTAYSPISYNDYYVSGVQGVLGYLGADQTTLAAFNTAFTGNPATPAYNVTAPFTTPTDLHLVAATVSILESGGAGGLGVGTDIDNETRPGPPGSANGGGTAPDVGADEFDGTPVATNDIAATAFVDPVSPGSKPTGTPFAPQASFTNLGLAGQTNVRVRYRIVGPSPSTAEVYNDTTSIASIASMALVTATFPSATIATAGSYTIYASSELAGDQKPGNDQITGSLSAVDPLSGVYYVGVTKFKEATGTDLTFEPVVRKVTREVLEPADNPDRSSAPDRIVWKTVTREVEEVTWVPMSNGQKYEGSLGVCRKDRPGLPEHFKSGTYATITAAVSDLNAVGVSGPVQFLLTDATYPSETFPITVNVVSAPPTATNTVTIKPDEDVTAAVSGASASGALFKVVNTNYITIDGSNATDGTTRDLTLENTSATGPIVVWFGSIGTTPVTNGTLKNCVVRNGVNTNSAVVISDGTTAGSAGYFSDMEIRNNKIEKAYVGVYANGGTTPQGGLDLTYVGNELNTSGTNAIRNVGLYMQGVDGAAVENNDVGNFETSTGETDYGIWLASGTINAAVNANRVHDIRYTGTAGYGGKGIGVSTGAASAGITVSNNMIFNITGDGDSYGTFGATYDPVGIYAFGTQNGIGIYDNSIFLYGNTINYSATAYSIGIGLDDAAYASVSGNNVVNNLGRLGATGAGAVAIALETSAAQLTAGDYNNLYCNATGGGTNLVGKIGATDYATMAAWRTASGQDANSITADPQYAGNTDLHIRTDVVSPVSNAGTTIVGVAKDYDGDERGATPDIGADEFTVYTLATAVVGSGSIDVSPLQAVYPEGAEVALTALPASGWSFVDWTGDLTGSANPDTLLMDADKSVTANFAQVTISVADAGVTEGNAGTVNADFVVTLSVASEDTVKVNYQTADDTATTADNDYVAASGQLVFIPGAVADTVSVTVNGDVTVEPNEAFFLNLSAAVNAVLADSVAVGTITNDDGAPSLSIDDVTVTEGNAGTVNAVFTVSLSAPSASPVQVLFATADGTATAGLDYAAAADTVDFPALSVSQPVTIVVNGDVLDEIDETYTVRLYSPVNAVLADSVGLGTITDDDDPPSISIGDVSLLEGDSGTTAARFAVALSAASGKTVTVQYQTSDGTATVADSDYQAITPAQTLTFLPGAVADTISVLVNGDTNFESDETFFVDLSSPVNATLADGQGQGTIQNDDSLVGVESPVPARTFLGVAYPNPFAGMATIPFGLKESGSVRIDIFDVGGRLVRGLREGFEEKGYRRVTWDGRDNSGTHVASGIYMVRLQAGSKTFTQTLMLLK
jgi:hypothetical protein